MVLFYSSCHSALFCLNSPLLYLTPLRAGFLLCDLGADAGQVEQCRILKQVAAELLACKKRGASDEETHVVLMKGLVSLTQIKAANRTLCEETERVRFWPTAALPTSISRIKNVAHMLTRWCWVQAAGI